MTEGRVRGMSGQRMRLDLINYLSLSFPFSFSFSYSVSLVAVKGDAKEKSGSDAGTGYHSCELLRLDGRVRECCILSGRRLKV